MHDSIRLGRIAGISIGVNWSVVLIGWLLGWGLATQLLPAAAPSQPTPAYWIVGFGVAVVFFASLLAHELAHALFARRAGVEVQGITLWLLGGVAKLAGEAKTAGDELRIAASGPIVSGLLGLGFTAASAGLGAAGAPVLLAEGAAWLARVNLLLAAFNLLPGAPLDGGRIVRALAWRLGRDRLRASLLATGLGRMLGFGLIAFGVLELVAGADVGGIWTIVIGLFLTFAAAAEGAQEVARTALGGLKVRDVMTREPMRVPGNLTLDVFAGAILAERQTAALVVAPGGAVVGVAGAAEVAKRPPAARRESRVAEIAVPLEELRVVAPDDELLAAWGEAEAAPAGETAPGPPAYLLVQEGGEIVGIVGPADLERTLRERGLGVGGRREASEPTHG